MTRAFAAIAALLCAASASAAVPSISQSSVSVSQDGASRVVRVDYTLDNAAAVVTAELYVGGRRVIGSDLKSLAGDVNCRVAEGERTFYWRPDLPVEPGELEVNLAAYSVFNPPTYMLIECTYTNAPVRYYTAMDQFPFDGGVTNDLAKTEFLVMRKIPARNVTWTMGKTGATSGYTKPHKVTFTDNYYMGVYEMTLAQTYYLSGKTDGNSAADGRGETYQKATTYEGTPAKLRGTLTAEWRGWPQEGHDVLPNSLIWKFRQKTPIQLDLPTSAQWEFAARAGSSGVYFDGTTTASDVAFLPLGWCSANVTGSSNYQPVGRKLPNRWGLYDVLGNVYEQCLDWHDGASRPDETDPVGPDNASGTLVNRIYRSYSVANSSGQCVLHDIIGLNDSRGYRMCAPCYAPGPGTDGEEGEGEPLGSKEMQMLDPVRIVIVGETQVAKGVSHSSGFVKQMKAAFTATYTNRETKVVALAKSNFRVDDWISLEASSRTVSTTDDNGVNITDELAVQEPDWMVLNLGNVEANVPYYGASEVSSWKAKYQTFVMNMRDRCSPKHIALCAALPCGEDPTGPKNTVIAMFNNALRELCDENGYTYIPATDDLFALLARCRRFSSEYHLMDDVNPTTMGHYSIAESVLRGVGETNSANWVEARLVDPYIDVERGKNAVLSMRRISESDAGNGAFTFTLAYDYTAADGSTNTVPEVAVGDVTVPSGWSVVSAGGGRVVVTGVPDRLYNDVSVAALGLTATCRIPAPWKVVPSVVLPANCWPSINEFDNDKADLVAASSIDYSGHVWQTFFASPDYIGYGSNMVNFAQVSYLPFYDCGFGKRKVYSSVARDVSIVLYRAATSAYEQAQVYVNGETVLDKYLSTSYSETVSLNAGWNEIGFRCAHRTWYNTVSVSIVPIGSDDLSDLRYALP